MIVVAAGLALVSAALFAVAAAAQQRAAQQVPDEHTRGLRLILVLLRRPLWWVGTFGDLGGYAAQAAALGVGSLLLVQPLLVTTLLFALPLAAWWGGRRLSRVDTTWAVLLAIALALFVVVAEPTAGVNRAPIAAWLPAAAVLGVVLAVCLAVAAARRGTARALLLAAATALAYGVTAALTKAVVSLLDDGPVALLTAWETPGLVVAGVGGTVLSQSAFQAGGLAASLPIITAGEPVVAVVLGMAVLGERVQVDGAEWVVFPVLVVVMAAATMALARSAAHAAHTPAGPDGAATPPTARGTNSSPSPGTARKPSAPA